MLGAPAFEVFEEEEELFVLAAPISKVVED